MARVCVCDHELIEAVSCCGQEEDMEEVFLEENEEEEQDRAQTSFS